MVTREKLSYDVDAHAGLGFGLVLAAGLSTAIGAAAVYVNRIVQLASQRVLACGLGFSAGVMLYVSFVEIMGKSQDAFSDYGLESGALACTSACFFGGIFGMMCIGWLTHKLEPHHSHCIDGAEVCGDPVLDPNLEQNSAQEPQGQQSATQDMSTGQASAGEIIPELADSEVPKATDAALQRMGINTALAIAIHNFPEGLATFVATLGDPTVGATLAIAIAIHNIPEGLCVALPIFYSSGSRHRAFLWALLSGLSEPVGALVGYALIKVSGEDMNALIYGILFGLVAGMMVGIVLSELLPTGLRYDPEGKYLLNFTIAEIGRAHV
eukprot:TRINITY_DN45963_c0_g1_i1.p1 TRINITY_DN45963_c0_g1~~TRINITY_DN45963_c0_g1_i1.p1  ORF type:complete len:333 (-),score=49.96 TRINITY_DN45963_c0_g1_i1:7-981(-)